MTTTPSSQIASSRRSVISESSPSGPPTAARGRTGSRSDGVGTVRRELLDRVIVLNERHLQRLLREYVDYYNKERIHTSLRDSPNGRRTENRPSANAKVVGMPRVGGLHHRYKWSEAA
jgi:hypothetical protein